jgi:hypothetical protein
MTLTRGEAAYLLRKVGLRLPYAAEVRRLGLHEYLLPTGAKVKVGWAGRLSYRLDGYAAGGADVVAYERELAGKRAAPPR